MTLMIIYIMITVIEQHADSLLPSHFTATSVQWPLAPPVVLLWRRGKVLQLRHLLLSPLPHLVLHLILSLARIESYARASR